MLEHRYFLPPSPPPRLLMTQGQDAISPPTALADPVAAETDLVKQLLNSESSSILLPAQEPMPAQ